MSDLWGEVYSAFEFHRRGPDHPPDPSAQAALNRIAAKCLKREGAQSYDPSNCDIHREILTYQQLTELRRHHARKNPARDCEPIVVIHFAGERWVVEGNNRVNKWLVDGSARPRSAIVITPRLD